MLANQNDSITIGNTFQTSGSIADFSLDVQIQQIQGCGVYQGSRPAEENDEPVFGVHIREAAGALRRIFS